MITLNFRPQVLVGGFRAALRRGDDFPTIQRKGPQKATLVAVPLFHVTGSTSFSVSRLLLVIQSNGSNRRLDDGHDDRYEDCHD